ncbi:E3 SUMO-protein ligase ZBED1-like [Haematobia irritans]|uniref:E3 SUMO-protein ligase ZBED1-like n=1 Tax=Haematobia irritans TaxID=7368 RepID=UPI003F4FF50E
MIATDIQPFSIVDDIGFREFVKCLDHRYEVPCRAQLQKVHMVNFYSDLKTKLENVLGKVEYCAITTDCWTSRGNEGYITVTCHFLTDNFSLKSAVLSTRKLLEVTNHSASNIAVSLRAILDEWNIFNKVTYIVTDNASSMIKACDILQKKHLPCFAHTVNLLVQDCLSEGNLKELFAKCKKIVSYFRSSTIAYEKFKAAQGNEKAYSLVQEVPTRWNSAYKMIERILLTSDSIAAVLLSTPKAPLSLTADEIEILKDVKQLLSLFDTATVQTSSSSTVTISLIIPIVCGLFENLEDLKGKLKTTEGFDTYLLLIGKIRKRLCLYEERTAPRFGTLLDPRFKKEGFRVVSNADQATKGLENEIAGIHNVNKEYATTVIQPTSNKNPSSTNQPLFKFLATKVSSKVRTCRMDAILDMRQYLEKDIAGIYMNPLEYWKCIGDEATALQTCAKRYLCIPATSTESERMFSKAGQIISDRRSRLKPKNVDMLLFINKNYRTLT